MKSRRGAPPSLSTRSPAHPVACPLAEASDRLYEPVTMQIAERAPNSARKMEF